MAEKSVFDFFRSVVYFFLPCLKMQTCLPIITATDSAQAPLHRRRRRRRRPAAVIFIPSIRHMA